MKRGINNQGQDSEKIIEEKQMNKEPYAICKYNQMSTKDTALELNAEMHENVSLIRSLGKAPMQYPLK